MSEGLPVKFGHREYRIVPQKIGRIRRKVLAILNIADAGLDAQTEITDQLYDVLKVFVPDIAPKYELLGFTSQENYEAGVEPDDDAEDGSPTLPQINSLLDTIYKVNQAERLVRLGKGLIDVELLKTVINKKIALSSLEESSSLPSLSGDSPSPSSTTTDPTSSEQTDSPSPSSSDSSTPESAAVATS